MKYLHFNSLSPFLIIVILIILFPFISFNFLVDHHFTLLLNPTMGYPVILISSLCAAYFVDKTLKKQWFHENRDLIIISLAACLICYSLYLFIMTWYRYDFYVSEAIDLNYFHQTIWQLSEFKLPLLYHLNAPAMTVWAQHFSPILILLAPFYWLSKNAEILMNLQSIAVISGAIPIYLVCKKYLPSRSIGLAISFAYLAFGGMQYGYAYGFHEIMFFPPLFFWTYYFYIKREIKLYYLFLFLSLLVKEEISFIVFFWSLYIFIFKKDRLHGSISAALGFLWYLLCFDLVFPAFNQGRGFSYWGQYDQKGGSGFIAVIISALSNPINFISSLFIPSVKIDTLLEIFGSFAFIIFLFPPALLLIFPSLMEKLMSSGIAMANGAHYSTAVGTMIVIATIEATKKGLSYKYINKHITHATIFFAIFLWYTALFSNVFYGYAGYSLTPRVHATRSERGLTYSEKLALEQAIKMIPENATVGAQYQIVPHINKDYKRVADWPQAFPDEDYIIVDTNLLAVILDVDIVNKELEKLYVNPNYSIVYKNNGAILFQKKSYKAPALFNTYTPFP